MRGLVLVLLTACGGAPPAEEEASEPEVARPSDALTGRWEPVEGATGEAWILEEDGDARWIAPDRCGDRVAVREGNWSLDGEQLVVRWTAEHRETGHVQRGDTCDRRAVRSIRARVSWSEPMVTSPCAGRAGAADCRRWSGRAWQRADP